MIRFSFFATPSRISVIAAFLLYAVAGSSLLTAQDPPPIRATEQGILVDFQDVELRHVMAALAEAGGVNVVYGDLPSRRITLRMQQPVARAGIPALIRSLAQSNGLVVREDGGFLRLEQSAAGMNREEDLPARGSPDTRLFVYRLKHTQAPRLAATLQSLFGARGSAVTGAAQGTLTDRMRQQHRIPPLDPNAPVAQQPSPPTPALPQGSLAVQLTSDVQIVPDETTNSLLIRATPADWDVIRPAVEALDLRPLQVLIEVLIAEVRRSRDLEVGVSASVEDRRSPRRRATGSAELKGSTAGDFVLRILREGDIDVTVALSALAAQGDVTILSRPLLFAQNNQEAKILIGSQRPFVQVFRSLPTGDAVRDQIVQYRDVGTSLTLTPTINPDGYVNLRVTQEVSAVTGDDAKVDAPIIGTREATTQVFMRDGQTAVVGGLVERQRDRTRTGIPILSSIPGIGGLFGSTSRSDVHSELFLFLTAHIVRTDEELEQLRESIQQRPEVAPLVSPDAGVIRPSPRTP